MRPRSVPRVYAIYAASSLVTVAALGFLLATGYGPRHASGGWPRVGPKPCSSPRPPWIRFSTVDLSVGNSMPARSGTSTESWPNRFTATMSCAFGCGT